MTRIREEDLMEQEGIDYLSTQVRRMKHVWRVTSTRDVGIDGEIELFDEGGHATGKIIKVQSKAGRSYIRNEKTDRFDYYGDSNHINYWARLINPVIIFIFDPNSQTAYWVDFKKYLRTHPEVQNAPYKIIFDKSRKFTADNSNILWSLFEEDDTEAEHNYRRHVIDKHGKLTLYSVASDKPLAVDLERVFVTLTAVERRRQHSSELRHSPSLDDNPAERHSSQIGSRVVPILRSTIEEVSVALSPGEALRAHNHLIILGAPGAGKTTLLKYLALTFSRSHTHVSDRLALNESRMPIFVALRDFNRFLDNLVARKELGDLGPKLLPKFLQDHFHNTAPHLMLPNGFFDRALESGRCIILLDGMDEVADPFKRARIAEEIVTITQHYRSNRFVLTSRPRGYEGEPKQRLSPFYIDCTIRDFDDEEMEAFAQSWYEAVTVDRLTDNEEARTEARRQAEDLLMAIHSDVRVRTLAPNPLLLSVLAMVHQRGVGLPQRRAELYQECIEMMLGYWDQTKGGESARDLAQIGELDRDEKRMVLESAALWFHKRGEQGLEADRSELIEVIASYFQENGYQERQSMRRAESFLELIEERAGLLVEREPGVFAFAHLTFQEYLAARAIADQDNYIEYSLAHLHDPWWREVLLLEVAHLTSNQRLGRRARKLTSSLIRSIMDAGSWMEETLRRDLLFAARCTCDTGKLGMDETLRREIIDRLLSALFDTPHNKQRNQIIEVLIYALPTSEGAYIRTSLIERCSSSNSNVREVLANTLERIFSSAPSLDVLRALLLLNESGEVRTLTSSIRVRSDLVTQDMLINLTRDSNPRVREEAIRSLVGTPYRRLPKKTVSVLVLALQDSSPSVRWFAVKTLLNFKKYATELEKTEIITATTLLSNDPEVTTKQAALRVTNEFLSNNTTRHLDYWTPGLDEESELVINGKQLQSSHKPDLKRKNAVKRHSHLLMREWIHSHHHYFWHILIPSKQNQTTSPHHQIWGDVADWYSWDFELSGDETETEDVPSVVIRRDVVPLASIPLMRYSDPDPRVRALVAKNIGDIDPKELSPECTKILGALLRDADSRVRQASANALGCLGPAALSNESSHALALLLQDSDPNVCFSAVNALSDLGSAALSQDSLSTLLRLFVEAPKYVRGAALNAMKRLAAAAPEVRATLPRLLESPNKNMREAAIQAIISSGFSASFRDLLPKLCSLLSDVAPNVRDVAAIALEKVGGEELGPELRGPLVEYWKKNLNKKNYNITFEKRTSEAAYEALYRLSIHYGRVSTHSMHHD
ncbi:HEAT repeat domain-containing protein [Cystobacter fuscus]|uniref:HEAT repeat domain-containing protein n=1 Tax=Cystobacter fuscus TaxID=43 RepID=UPI002B2F8D33|nr:DUF4365 domain-containing protein [Cystobacter fuscus]